MKRSETIGELAKALAAAQGEFQAVPKASANPFFKSKYASLPDVVLAASPILSKHGLSVSQLPDFDGQFDLLTTTLMHSSGEWIEASARLHLVKDDPQAQGSAITYQRRYSYSGAVGVVTDEDDDGNAASGRGSQRTVQPAAAPPPPVTAPAPPPASAAPTDPLDAKIAELKQGLSSEQLREAFSAHPSCLVMLADGEWKVKPKALAALPGEAKRAIVEKLELAKVPF